VYWLRALALGAVALFAAVLPAARASADTLSEADFEALLNQSFYVNTDRGVVILDLVEVQEQSNEAKGPARKDQRTTKQFSLTFVGPTEPGLPSAIYRLDHRSLGNSDIYLEDAGIDGSARRYRARFTVLR
jgi:hypothetical protein